MFLLVACGDDRSLVDAGSSPTCVADAPPGVLEWRDVFAAYARGACIWDQGCSPNEFYEFYLDVPTCAREVTDEACMSIGGVIPCDDSYAGAADLLAECTSDLIAEPCTVGSEPEPNSCAVALAVLRGD